MDKSILREKMFSLASEYHSSGKTQAAFAEDHEINMHTVQTAFATVWQLINLAV
nr:hypothetical protein [Bacteroidota bacterium]